MASKSYAELAKEAGTGFEPLPVGPHAVEVTSAEAKQSAAGNAYFRVEFTVTDGPHKSRKVWTNLTLAKGSPGSVSYFFSKMKALGLGSEFFATLPEDDTAADALICQSLVGAHANVFVKNGDYNGSVTNEVDKICASSIAKTVAGVPSTEPAAAGAAAPALPPGL